MAAAHAPRPIARRVALTGRCGECRAKMRYSAELADEPFRPRIGDAVQVGCFVCGTETTLTVHETNERLLDTPTAPVEPASDDQADAEPEEAF